MHLVFGEFAAKALHFGSEFKKGKRSFWSEKLGGHVLLVWHPSYLLRQGFTAGGVRPPNDRFKKWRKDLLRTVSFIGGDSTFVAR